jgi:hypothetical protein
MTVLENFIAFASALPADQHESVEEALAALMESLSAEFNFAPAELVKLDHRLAEPKPEYSSPAAISKLFGKPFSG